MDIIGRTIANRYEIINKTGVGGMATVYVAKDKVLNRNVAVKVLKDEFTTDEEFVKRFNSEAQAAASLSHPNIVSIYDVGNEDNIYYFHHIYNFLFDSLSMVFQLNWLVLNLP